MILQWHEAFPKASTGTFKATVYTYGPCLWLHFSTGLSAFYAPDGHRARTEAALIKHMDNLAAKNGLQTSGGDSKKSH